MLPRGGKAWFAIEAKSFEIAREEKGKKLKGCNWERCEGVTSWIKFGDNSLQHLLLRLEDCKNIAHNQDWFTKWEKAGRRYKLERRSNNTGSFIRCTVRDLGAKWFCLCFPKGKGFTKGWKLLLEKLKMLGVGFKKRIVENITKRKAPSIRLKKKSSPETKFFTKAVVGTKHEVPSGAVKVSVGEEEIAERLKKLSCCLMGWWGGGTSPMPDLKTVKRQAWSAWEVIGSLNVVEMGKGLWFFEFDNAKEAERILMVGTKRLEGFSIFLKKWTKEGACITGKNFKAVAWVKLIGLPLHL